MVRTNLNCEIIKIKNLEYIFQEDTLPETCIYRKMHFWNVPNNRKKLEIRF